MELLRYDKHMNCIWFRSFSWEKKNVATSKSKQLWGAAKVLKRDKTRQPGSTGVNHAILSKKLHQSKMQAGAALSACNGSSSV